MFAMSRNTLVKLDELFLLKLGELSTSYLLQLGKLIINPKPELPEDARLNNIQ